MAGREGSGLAGFRFFASRPPNSRDRGRGGGTIFLRIPNWSLAKGAAVFRSLFPGFFGLFALLFPFKKLSTGRAFFGGGI